MSGGCVTFKVASQLAIATDPSEGPLDDPSFGQEFETGSIGSLYDLQLPRSDAPDNERQNTEPDGRIKQMAAKFMP